MTGGRTVTDRQDTVPGHCLRVRRTRGPQMGAEIRGFLPFGSGKKRRRTAVDHARAEQSRCPWLLVPPQER